MKRFFVTILLIMPLVIMAGEEKKQNTWEPFQFFIGKWTGTGEGKNGESTLECEYRFRLNEKFIFNTNRAVFKPTEKNKEGEIHEEFGVLSYDRIRGKYVFRQFHVEGFVNQYTVDISPDSKTYTFTSENIENLPPGWKVRTIIKIEGENTFHERFELAGPGKNFACLITSRFTRKK